MNYSGPRPAQRQAFTGHRLRCSRERGNKHCSNSQSLKQGHDQDPDGTFVHQRIPELNRVRDTYIHERGRWSEASSLSGKTCLARRIESYRGGRNAGDRSLERMELPIMRWRAFSKRGLEAEKAPCHRNVNVTSRRPCATSTSFRFIDRITQDLM